MSDEQRARLRAGWARRHGLPGNRTGIRHTEETRRRISERTRERTPRGAAHYAWKGGVAADQKRDRKSPGYQTWRNAVATNAGRACECCQNRYAGRMHAHHIKGFSDYPALRLDPSNGAWLCDDCHGAIHAFTA